ncbi:MULTISPECIES: protein translocase subunit SecD [unclassified Microcella]|uniref:protein translocase subunit SecD n=1 Tax=unclassified Microcella TaxID=2630066 RepID=UPI0006FB037F|nr:MULTISPECIES: protein translocase subunit SecD [unclassified Microcella]KQV24977.1 preprotein translocase subunit SecD [Yonghaparkia sp. Root332]KRF31262.1 preprotein translocase subunit SecD [Yonghaparkia sp. Soil809]
MARSTPERRALRSLVWLLVIIVALIGGNAASVLWNEGSWAPRLALDLEGGTQLTLTPQLSSGQSVSQEQLDQAVGIIRQRVDAAGVSESEINTQGGQNIVVSIPGTPDEATLQRIRSSAKLEFRAVLTADLASSSTIGEEGAAGDPSASPSPSSEPSEEPSAAPSPSASPTDASDPNWITPELQKQFEDFDCATVTESGANVAPEDEPLVTCEADSSLKYILGPVEVTGARIADASSGLIQSSTGVSTNEWGVFLEFDGEGTDQFREVTERLVGLEGVRNQFAIVLDGQVISAPRTISAITNGQPQITGNFTQESAKTLADQLKFGALPIGFELQSQDQISATLGVSQLQSGIIAGLVGLALVVLYSLLQYRALGGVTIASLIIAGIVTYLLITYLSNQQGYRLSLAGVAGLIIAVGVIADSFIVYFERIRDELRDGRRVDGAVEAGWKRAFRTILISDVINVIAAVVLFVLAIGNVRGFAFTLGLTTVVDLVVVALFTHPMMQLLGRTSFFSGGHPLSGLDPKALGAVYRGRAQFRPSAAVSATKRASSSREAQRRQTIAERKAAEQSGEGKDAR